MKFSIGHRLFASVLLALLAVAASTVLLLRQNVLASFGDYAVGIELDRLDELSTALARQYRGGNGWTFIADSSRGDWIASELARLQRVRERAGLQPAAPPAPPEPPEPPVAPALSASSAPPPPPLPPPPPAPPAMAGADAALPLARRITLLDAGGRYLAGRVPGTLPLARRAITVNGSTVGWLAVARSPRPSDAMAYAFLDQLQRSLWVIVAVAVLLSALAATLLARHFRRPIRDLDAGARRLAGGDFDVRLTAARSDELGDLARHFNTLAAQLASAESARRQWVADTSHELRTPLAVLRAQLEALQDGVRSATPDTLDGMLRQVLALNKLIDELYALARADVGALDCRPAPLDLWQLAADHARGFEARLRGAGLALDVGPAPASASAIVSADPDRMRQVLDNLFENSLRYTAPGGRIHLHGMAAAHHVTLHLDDGAPGVPDAALARLGGRFYRVDASRSRAHGGAGLGLALCRRLLEAQGGRLAFAHAPGGGLRASITLPRNGDHP